MMFVLSVAVASGAPEARADVATMSSQATSSAAIPTSTVTQLDALAPFVGYWVAESRLQKDIPGLATAGDRVVIPMLYTWTLDRQFLAIAYSISVNDTTLVRYRGMMGWDPVNRQIRSWGFDSNGAQTSAYWTRTANGWTAHVTAVQPNGKETTSLLRRVDQGADAFTLELTDQMDGGPGGRDAWRMEFRRGQEEEIDRPAPVAQQPISEQNSVDSTAPARPTSDDPDLAKDLAKVQGKWERWEQSGFFKRRVTKEINGNTEKVTYYQISGEVDAAHRVDFQLERGPGGVRIFHCFNMTFVEGPDKGTTSGRSFAYAYTVSDGSLVEIWGALAGEEERPLRITEWTRAKD
jgi:hypothetical protein